MLILWPSKNGIRLLLIFMNSKDYRIIDPKLLMQKIYIYPLARKSGIHLGQILSIYNVAFKINIAILVN